MPKHIPALDGLRGAAILLVLLLHFTPSLDHYHPVGDVAIGFARMGWSGVNLFFVLSGFLITSILLAKRDIWGFYRNRVLRIFPLYYLALLVFLIFTPPNANQLWLWGYAANIPIAWTGEEVFDARMLNLSHFWSLAIEEQFYFVWPLLVLKLSDRALKRLCYAGMLLAIALRLVFVLAEAPGQAAYVFTLCRTDAMLLGAWLALTRESWLPGRFAALLGICVACLAALVAWRGQLGPLDPVVQVVGYPLLDWMFAAMLVLAVRTPVARVFENGALRFFGKYSYGLYVYHYLFLGWFDHFFPIASWVEWSFTFGLLGRTLLGVAMSTGIAMLSFHVLEKHVRRLKKS